MLVKADNQPIDTRFGDAIWLTDFITPDNPSVVLKYRDLTRGLVNDEEKATALWRYVANQPYSQSIYAKLQVGGKTFKQSDTWFLPAESIQIEIGNCANKSFLLASMLKNYLYDPGEVYCVIGELRLDGIGGHAWVEASIDDQLYIIETTQPNLSRALIPKYRADAYQGKIYFDDENVYTEDNVADIKMVLDLQFGVCAIDFLEEYLCERCLEL